jgi:hypothetical protein
MEKSVCVKQRYMNVCTVSEVAAQVMLIMTIQAIQQIQKQ